MAVPKVADFKPYMVPCVKSNKNQFLLILSKDITADLQQKNQNKSMENQNKLIFCWFHTEEKWPKIYCILQGTKIVHNYILWH